ncbi:predicted protein [Uncinocarpus reesii 1704]|uniref:Uncharacterized protein n=1 Tax=Uncinocarpus reesii (strain UAMH 1704) TaxID=336963 RepID=C4JX93_UNCRE|nr:uncharacterized protein UREG_06266 [Uncinocarpus reesii 1704]EEP81401.1 predicted protein [Uncinocarpus reesii 1704]
MSLLSGQRARLQGIEACAHKTGSATVPSEQSYRLTHFLELYITEDISKGVNAKEVKVNDALYAEENYINGNFNEEPY